MRSESGVRVREQVLAGWGRRIPAVCHVVTPRSVGDVSKVVQQASARGVVARGLGRSYGDAAQNSGGFVIDMTVFGRIISIDLDTQVVDVEAGLSLDALLRTVLPHGLWVPVLPGTRQVTIGGAIASDIHGKNHHTQGSFGNHVVSVNLMLADGSIQTLLPDGEGSELFWATVGGMGLTGIILSAKIRLIKTETAYFIVDSCRTRNLSETMEILTNGSDDRYEYSVSVPDTISTDARMGRASFSRGSLAKLDDLPRKLRKRALTLKSQPYFSLPDIFPSGLVNRTSMTMASRAYYYATPNNRRDSIQGLTAFYQPLDLIGNWNRAYGRRGFLQYQFSIPFSAEDALVEILRRIAHSGHHSFLNVFKRMGAANRAPLSWPHPGFMLSLDFTPRGGLTELLDSLDADVVQAGGRLYFAKDSRMNADHVGRMYPRLEEWRAIRRAADPNGVFISDLSRRLLLI